MAAPAPANASSTASVKPPSPREVLWTAIGLVVFLEIIKDIARFTGGYVATGLYTLAAVVQLFYPIWRLEKLYRDPEAEIGLRPASYALDLKLAALLGAITFVPFAIGHHYYWTVVFHYHFAWGLPKDPLTLVLTHLLGVALPEEVFYRGYIQPRLTQFTRKWRVFGADVGWEIPVTAAIFAFGHFAGEYDPSRLGPFFPALLFGWLRARTGSVYGAVVYHAASNVLSAFLFACYRP
jgi:membrane protease YdiL (CAAX protease family)